MASLTLENCPRHRPRARPRRKADYDDEDERDSPLHLAIFILRGPSRGIDFPAGVMRVQACRTPLKSPLFQGETLFSLHVAPQRGMKKSSRNLDLSPCSLLWKCSSYHSQPVDAKYSPELGLIPSWGRSA